jgi:hypothetical protein
MYPAKSRLILVGGPPADIDSTWRTEQRELAGITEERYKVFPTFSARLPRRSLSAMNCFAVATPRAPRSLCPAPATHSKRLLGGLDQAAQPLAEGNRNDGVVLAVTILS